MPYMGMLFFVCVCVCSLFNYTTTILHQKLSNDKVCSHIIFVVSVFVILYTHVQQQTTCHTLCTFVGQFSSHYFYLFITLVFFLLLSLERLNISRWIFGIVVVVVVQSHFNFNFNLLLLLGFCYCYYNNQSSNQPK